MPNVLRFLISGNNVLSNVLFLGFVMDVSLTCLIHAKGLENSKIKGGNLTAFQYIIKILNVL
jgi:hypothetical protein